MKERLAELIKSIEAAPEITCPRYSTESTLEDCKGCQYDKGDGSCDYASREADYFLENGVIVPPCKVGQTVYKFNRYNKTIIDECRIRSILQREDGSLKIMVIDLRYMNYFEILPDAIGETVFLTREEAEKTLAEEPRERRKQ